MATAAGLHRGPSPQIQLNRKYAPIAYPTAVKCAQSVPPAIGLNACSTSTSLIVPICRTAESHRYLSRSSRCRSYNNQFSLQPSGEGPSSRTSGALSGGSGSGSTAGNGVFLLMLLCCLVFVADNLLHLPGLSALYLNHARPQWWQFVSHMFCHSGWAHLSGNLFNLCVFGRMVEETEGPGGLVLAFLICGLGAAVATFFLTPSIIKGHAVVSVGASGAIFGLFAVSVATRLKWSLKHLLEAAVLGQFVVRQVLEEAKHQVSGGLMVGGVAVSHAAHLAGAAVGVLLVLLLQRLPDPGPGTGASRPGGGRGPSSDPGAGVMRG